MSVNKKARVNGKSIPVFPGMTVRHVLSSSQVKAVESGKKDVYDRHGNVVGLEGAVQAGAEFKIS